MKVYISGPMTGYVNHNRDAFYRAHTHLVAKGFEVVNPAFEDDQADTSTWRHEDYMRRDIGLMLDCDAIYFLPGWTHSKGAGIEHQVAKGIGLMEVHDPDVELWRTFEGEPEVECDPVDHSTCDAVEGDGYGHEWCEHGSLVKPSPLADGSTDEPLAEWERELLGMAEESPVEDAGDGTPAPDDAEDLSDHPQWGRVFADIDYAVDDSLPENTLRLITETGHVDFEVTWSGPEMHLERRGNDGLTDAERAASLADYRAKVGEKPQPGDAFPNVGYVRRFLSLMNRAHNSGERRSA